MNVDDSYRELGLAPGSSDAEVKAAWRRLAARWHPDRNTSPQALRKIQRINRALDEIRRARGGAVADDVAEEAAAPARPVAEQTIRITLEEAVAGCTRELQGELVEDCSACEGHGLQKHASTCSACGGSGRVRQHLWFPWLSPSVDCSACGGIGLKRHRCAACGGSGKAPARRYRCRVQVPAGTRAGDRLDVTARVQGHQRKHQLALRVRVELQPHELFTVERDGTVKCELPVDGFAWTASRWIEVPTPRGLQQMRLRRGALNYRIKGQGLPGADGAPADCIVTVVPLFPEEFSKTQEAAIDRLIAGNSGTPGTPAGDRVAEWTRRVQRWATRQR